MVEEEEALPLNCVRINQISLKIPFLIFSGRVGYYSTHIYIYIYISYILVWARTYPWAVLFCKRLSCNCYF